MWPDGEPHNHPLQRTGTAGKLNRVRNVSGARPRPLNGLHVRQLNEGDAACVHPCIRLRDRVMHADRSRWRRAIRDTRDRRGAGHQPGRAEPSRTEADEWKAHDGSRQRTKRISLDEHFVIELHCSEDRSSLTGFAMSLERTDVRTFSWEWFNMVSEHDARKLQGPGELFVQIDETGGQVVQTSFLSDVMKSRWRLYVLLGPYAPQMSDRSRPGLSGRG
jgi:hypothetical protein